MPSLSDAVFSSLCLCSFLLCFCDPS